MRILFISPILHGRENGYSLVTRHIVDALSELGSVELVECLPNSNGIRKSRVVSNPYSWLFPPAPRKFSLPSWVRKEPFDLVVGHSGLMAHELMRLPHPSYLIVGDCLSSITRNNPGIPYFARHLLSMAYQKYERIYYPSACGAQVTTEDEARVLSELCPSLPIHVNTNGVEQVESTRTPTLSHGEVRVFAVLGDFNAARNIHIAKRAIDLVDQLRHLTGNDLVLKVVGYNSSKISLPKWAISRDGFTEVKEAISDVDFGISIDPFSTGIKNSVLTLLAHSIPCIVSMEVARPILDCTKRSPDKSGLLVAKAALSDVANEVSVLLRDSIAVNSLGLAAHRASGFFTWSQYKSRLISNLQTIL